MAETVRFQLDESLLPKAWYNVNADMPVPPSPVLHPDDGAGHAGLPVRPLPDEHRDAGGHARALGRDPRARARDLPALAPDADVPGPEAREGARDTRPHLLQERERESGRLAQAEYGRPAGLLQQGGRDEGADDGDGRRPVGVGPRDG